MSSVPDRKFNSILKRIPVETVFDVLKFLTYKQWFALQFSNWRLAEIIKKNVNYLAFPKLYRISFRLDQPHFNNPLRNTHDGIDTKIEDLDEKEKSNLTEAFVKLNQVPLALYRSDKNPNKDNFLYIYIEMAENAEGNLLIKLPVHPSTIEELALIRFWLLKLSQTHFKEFDAYYGILNPEFLSVLNPRTGLRKILFHANKVDLHESAILADFAQFIYTRKITLNLRTSIIDEPCQNNLFKFIMGTRNALKHFRIITFGSKKGEFCEFLIKSIMHMETGHENVPEIIECVGHLRGSWPNISGAKFTGVDGANDPFGPYAFKKYRYTFNNLWNKKVSFCLELYGEEFESLRMFKIIKTTTKK